MDFYEEASLVMVPSGYKDQKVYSSVPDDGSADLTFSRASTATRVDSNGLIEKVRTNQVTYSNDYEQWIKDQMAATSGQAGYDGTNDAWLLDSTAGFIRRDVSYSGVTSCSVYAKAGTADGIRIRFDAATDRNLYVNLTDGSLISDATNLAYSIESVGSGWYRVTATADLDTGINVRFYVIDNTGINTTGTVYIQDAQLEQGLVATPYIETTSAAVSVGPVANLPRLSYDPVNPTSASLLLEPQRTNIIDQSEYFSAWYIASGVTITDNNAVSPEGVQNAALLERTTIGNVQQTKSVTSGVTYAISVFGKAGTSSIVRLIATGLFPATEVSYDLSDESITVETGSVIDSDIEDYGNGWYRCWFTLAPTSTGNGQIRINTGDNVNIYVYGAQLEAGSYPTSYIPTYGTSTTRVADAATKTGISSLIGQTEGTLFVDAYFDGVNQALSRMGLFVRMAGTNTGYAFLNFYLGKLNCALRVGGVTMFDSLQTGLLPAGRYKIAMGYKSGDTAIYMNGNQVATDTDTFGTTSYAEAYVGCSSSGVELGDGINQALLFQTRLSNDDLATLTSL